MKSNEKDNKILEILRSNARESAVEIAKSLNLTEGAVRHRINKLIKNGTIRKFTIETDLGGSSGIILVNATKDNKQMLKDITQKIDVDAAYEIAGEYDGCIILSRANIEELDRAIDQIRSLESVDSTRTMVSLKKWK